ncbi:MAG: FAD-dependent monooxygenase [Candidatus Eremiobacteraeota bacterium]|nr:FAD-dependent monooxygenase [Candidatus Eremiobacteraeota bacterium]
MSSTQDRPTVLIAGAGPTGLVLALSLARRGIPVRLIDQAEAAGDQSRAMAVQARTLEFYQQFGFADEVIASGVKMERVHLREGGDSSSKGFEVLSVTFRDLGKGLSPYPFALAFPQDDHQRLLVAKLQDAGVEVEWRTKLTDFDQDGASITARLEHGDNRTEQVRAEYLCGCDGAHSTVRETLKLGFVGGTYPQLYYVADVQIEGGFERDLFLNLGVKTLAILLPVRSRGVQRLIGLVPSEVDTGADLSFEELRPHVEPLIGKRVTQVNWFATYRVHHRVADHFQVGRAFICGDAGHVHSPVGGQGMNTGIGDAINLGWKLAMVARRRAAPTLLESYEAERIPFARTLVATTDRAFTQFVSGGLKGEAIRRFFIPLVFTLGTKFELGRHALFGMVSQIRISYEHGPLAFGKAGHVEGGERLPWIASDGIDNFAPLVSLDWQGHVYGDASSDLIAACEQLHLPVHIMTWSERAHEAGLEKDAFCLVRPDGYIAVATSGTVAASALEKYVTERGLRFSN